MRPSTPPTPKWSSWALAALSAAILFLGSLASDLLANDIGDKLRPYRALILLTCGIAFIVTIVVAIRKQRRSNTTAADSNNGDQTKPQGDVVARDKHEVHYHYATGFAANSLHQLPAPPHDFTGRVAELRELTAKLQPGGATISGVQGMGGVGKTALALKLAEALAPRYPDAQFYLDLRGVSDRPVTPAEAMAHVIRAYHSEAKLPEAEHELCGLYRSALHGQRALLLMDNAQDRAQVEPLIPPAGCALLVTSRAHFALPGLFAQNLNQMAAPEAIELLLKIAPRIGSHAAELAKLCGYLPLALRLAASALAERSDLAPEKYLRRLTDAQRRLELVDASLDLSYALLAPDAQQRWRSLAVFPATFYGFSAAAVWQMEGEAAEDALSELVKFSLVEWEADESRYRLHDLARVCAEARLSVQERDAAQRRHAEYYKDVLAAAKALYKEGGEAVRRGMSLFEAEHANIEAGQAWAAAQSEADKQAAQLCMDYPDAGAYVLDLRQHPRERIKWLEIALQAAQRLKRRNDEGIALGNLGIAYADLGETRRAIKCYEQCLAIAREIDDRHSESHALGSLGNAYIDLGETRLAIEFYEQALVIDREIGDRRSEGANLGDLGNAYAAIGEALRAIEFYEQALVIDRKIGDRHGEGTALGNLGNAYNDLGDARRAIEFYEQALVIGREIGDRRGEGNALWNTSLALNKLGKRAEAIARAEESLRIREQIEDPRAAKVRAQLAEWRGE